MLGISSASAEYLDLTIAIDTVANVSKGNHVRPGDYLRLNTYLTNNGPDAAPDRISVTGEGYQLVFIWLGGTYQQMQ